MNIHDEYNLGLENFDVANSLQSCYHFDHWTRKIKWWCYMFFWSFLNVLVNSYVAYFTFVEK